MSGDHTFWRLLEEHSVEIPIIQRDYAQGRPDKRSEQIRSSFVATLIEMVEDPTKSKDLDFVYGSLVDGKLVPLDGQQRLTTLFLLHWYLAWVSGNQGSASERLRRFTYRTRVAAQEFCEALVDPSHCVRFDKETLSETIMDAHWFFANWRSDPTVSGMLKMLDEIHAKFRSRQSDSIGLWRKLICPENPPITFHFLDMREFGLTDELYIKMNARGCPLTDFQNFKAWMQKKERSGKSQHVQRWSDRVDGQWTDLFWKCRDIENGEPNIDSPFILFFNRTSLAVYVAHGDRIAFYKDHAQHIVQETFISDDLRDYLFTKEAVSACFEVLDALSERGLESLDYHLKSSQMDLMWTGNSDKQGTRLFKKFISPKSGEASRTIQALFFTLSCFIGSRGLPSQNERDQGQQLAQWLRVVRNLCENSRMEADEFCRMLVSLSALMHENSDPDVCSHLECQSRAVRNWVGFSSAQVGEECIKAELIRSRREEWLGALVKSENHGIFRGRIGFLLMDLEESKPIEIETFRERCSVAYSLFKSKLSGTEREGFLLIRAALSKCDPIHLDWQQRLLLSDNHTNWRELLSGSESGRGFHRGVVRLIDWLRRFDQGEFSKELEDCCSEYNRDDHPYWMRMVVKRGDELLLLSHTQKVQMYYEHGVFLFKKSNAHVCDILLTEDGRTRDQVIDGLLNVSDSPYSPDPRSKEAEIDGVAISPGHNIELQHRSGFSLFFGSHEARVENGGDSFGIRIDDLFEEMRKGNCFLELGDFEALKVLLSERENVDAPA
jgi:hypothetical protein